MTFTTFKLMAISSFDINVFVQKAKKAVELWKNSPKLRKDVERWLREAKEDMYRDNLVAAHLVISHKIHPLFSNLLKEANFDKDPYKAGMIILPGDLDNIMIGVLVDNRTGVALFTLNHPERGLSYNRQKYSLV